MEIVIRQVRKEDNSTLANIIRASFDEFNAPHIGTVYTDPTTDDLYSLFQAPGSLLWVAETDNGLAGCCGLYHTKGLDKNCVELVKFYLSKECRGKGIGKELMEKCFQSARESGYTKIYLESLPQFSRAVKMYEKLGFITLDHPMGDSGHRTCHIWMLKELV
jgi:putative acetyltransferase